MHRLTSRIAVAISLLMTLPAVVLKAQTTATILGTVTDSTRAAVSGAIIQVRNTDTGTKLSLLTDDQGRFSANDLQIGPYEVQAEMVGFERMIQKGITLSIGSQIVLDF